MDIIYHSILFIEPGWQASLYIPFMSGVKTVSSNHLENTEMSSFVLGENKYKNMEGERKPVLQLFDSDFQVTFGAIKSCF